MDEKKVINDFDYVIDCLRRLECSSNRMLSCLSGKNVERILTILKDNPDITFEKFNELINLNYLEFLNYYLVEDYSILVRFDDYEIFYWLEDHGFTQNGEDTNCGWVFVDLSNMTFTPGKENDKFDKIISKPSINDDEFYTLMNILDHYDEITSLEEEMIEYIFGRKYKTIFEPVELTNYEMSQTIIYKLDELNAGNLFISFACQKSKINKTYSLITKNENITLKEIKDEIGWGKESIEDSNIYRIDLK